MGKYPMRLLTAACGALALAAANLSPAHAAGRIVCWKDASGKTIGCGDTVPPEYRDAARRELDSRGITRKTVESAEDAAKRREEAQAQARQKSEEEKRIADQRRRDMALLATFSNAGEIDAKRDREIQTLEFQIKQQRAALKLVDDRYTDLKARRDTVHRTGKSASANMADDLARVEGEKTALEQSIAAKEKEREDIDRRYAAMKTRYSELRGGSAGAPAR